ncbi:MAG: chloride channel protein, partial [Alistipes sp.]|nr:chloride channel protein [Alistipes sp.]
PLVISAVTATSLGFALRGFDPIFSVTMGSDFLLHDIPYFILMGVVCGLVAYYFTEMNSFVARQLHKIKQTYIRLIVGGVVIGSLIFLFPPLYGEGYEYLQNIINGNLSSVFDNSLFYEYKDVTWILILYLVGVIFFKVIAMSATNASGGVGGVFAPSLFIGAFTGAALSLIMNTLFGLELSPITFALVGMAGIMSGVLDAPLTAIFLIAEVTDSYELFVPLMMVSAISYLISYYLEPYSIYTRKLVLHGDLVTHDKDKAVLLFLDIRRLIENDMERVAQGITLGEMVNVVSRSHRNIFPVLDSDGYLQGVVTLDDIRRDMFDRDKYDNAISEYMTIPPDIIAVNDSMQTVLDKFETSHAWNLPVVDENSKYIGFVSKSKIFSAYRNQLIEISHN